MLPPMAMTGITGSFFTTRQSYVNHFRSRSPLTAMAWAPDGRRILASNEKGEIHELVVDKVGTYGSIICGVSLDT